MPIPHFDVARFRVAWGWLKDSNVTLLLIAKIVCARNDVIAMLQQEWPVVLSIGRTPIRVEPASLHSHPASPSAIASGMRLCMRIHVICKRLIVDACVRVLRGTRLRRAHICVSQGIEELFVKPAQASIWTIIRGLRHR